MLELRPTCEHCNKPLPPDSLEAHICTYECTFCATCVESFLSNVCPNCGGGFVPRPIRPSKNWKGDNFLGKDPASTKIKHRPVDAAAHALFSAAIETIPPEKRWHVKMRAANNAINTGVQKRRFALLLHAGYGQRGVLELKRNATM